MATAYDDAYNQTPERLIRNLIALGYRDDIIHYVGMSHFMRLARQGVGALLAETSGDLCAPAVQWHLAFFEAARQADLEVIASISPIPVHPRVSDREDGSIELSWTRRARGHWRWETLGEVPLVERSEQYLVGYGPADTPSARAFGCSAGGTAGRAWPS